jgi:hypothetical protein
VVEGDLSYAQADSAYCRMNGSITPVNPRMMLPMITAKAMTSALTNFSVQQANSEAILLSPTFTPKHYDA